MENIPTISVIVPVYNTEKYLNQCIDSILAQTFTDFELLLIDDGSTDNSAMICDEYAQKDSRVRVFHKKNGGVSSARNLGLDNACGEWIAFVDGDDWIKPNYLYSMISQSDADLIMSSFEIIDKVEMWDNRIGNELYNNSKIKFFLERYINTATLCAPWCKLFKKSIIGNLKFDETISFAEDTIFCFEYLEKVDSVKTISNFGYQYRRGLNEALSVKLLSISEYRDIIHEYSNSFKKLEYKFNYDGTLARIANCSNQLRKCCIVIKNSDRSLFNKYKELVNLLSDGNIQEILRYNNNEFKGNRRKVFDYLALNKLYLLLFIYVINYKGPIY